ncbi:hypothetical protein BS78_05G004200 [Paspalum vaginatum]|nr:hypothetical protein BS78_05G004200 [Paspalum vaginatum]
MVVKRSSVVVGDGDMCSVGIAHKRHRKGASERTEKPKEDEVYAAGSKEKGRKTRKKKLSGSKEKKALGNRREKLFVPKAKADNWKRKDMPRSDPSNEHLLIAELTGYMLYAPPEPIWDDPADDPADLDEPDRDLMYLESDDKVDELYTYMRKLKADVLNSHHQVRRFAFAAP